MVHPVRMNGTVIGASQTYEYFDMIQDRILSFISSHSRIAYDPVSYTHLDVYKRQSMYMEDLRCLVQLLSFILLIKDRIRRIRWLGLFRFWYFPVSYTHLRRCYHVSPALRS